MFIRLHRPSGQPVLINPDRVFCIYGAGDSCHVIATDSNDYVRVKESFDVIELLIVANTAKRAAVFRQAMTEELD